MDAMHLIKKMVAIIRHTRKLPMEHSRSVFYLEINGNQMTGE